MRWGVGRRKSRRKKAGLASENDAILLNNLGSAYFKLGQKDLARPYFEKALAILTHFYGDEHPNSKMVKKWLENCK
jgi:tetratricopeptide (TPR) repeat protein